MIRSSSLCEPEGVAEALSSLQVQTPVAGAGDAARVADWLGQVEREADSMRVPEIAEAASLARAVLGQRLQTDDLVEHALDVLTIACRNQQRRRAGDGPADIAPVLAALRGRLAYLGVSTGRRVEVD